MSLTTDGKHIHCDGPGCKAKALSPVALRFGLVSGERKPQPTVGWLFVTRQSRMQHFCPLCAPERLRSLSDTTIENKEAV